MKHETERKQFSKELTIEALVTKYTCI